MPNLQQLRAHLLDRWTGVRTRRTDSWVRAADRPRARRAHAPRNEGVVADELAERGESASDQYRELYDDELSQTVWLIHPSINDDGTPDYLVVVEEGFAQADAEAIGDSVRSFLSEYRWMDFSRGYTMAVYDASGDQLRRIDTTDCPRGDKDVLRCDPA